MSKKVFLIANCFFFSVIMLSAQAKTAKTVVKDTVKTQKAVAKTKTVTKDTVKTQKAVAKTTAKSSSATAKITTKSATQTKSTAKAPAKTVVKGKTATKSKTVAKTTAKASVQKTPSVTPAKKAVVVQSKSVPPSYSTIKKPTAPVIAKGEGLKPQTSVPVSIPKQILMEVNTLRKSGTMCGTEKMLPVKALVWNDKLEKAAILHVDDMDKTDRFSHAGSDGSLPDDRIKTAGYEWERVGENIGQGYKNVAAAIKGWKESANHCKQMMNPDITEMGAAQKGKYWVQTFAKPLE
ncbi:MAG: hypothetical protein JNL70_15055 [Saprospiraceae bacterium]|nr:hypothetical protein [Saprospiraceae bacterium]